MSFIPISCILFSPSMSALVSFLGVFICFPTILCYQTRFRTTTVNFTLPSPSTNRARHVLSLEQNRFDISLASFFMNKYVNKSYQLAWIFWIVVKWFSFSKNHRTTEYILYVFRCLFRMIGSLNASYYIVIWRWVIFCDQGITSLVHFSAFL